MDNYSVSTTLKLNDQLLGGLKRVVDVLRTAQREVDALQRALGRLGTSFRFETAGLKAAADAASKLRSTLSGISSQAIRPRVDLRAAEAGIARMRGQLVTIPAAVMPTGVGAANARMGAADLAAAERAVMSQRLHDAQARQRDEAALAAAKRRDGERLLAAERREQERTAKYIFRLQKEQMETLASAEKRYKAGQAAEAAQRQREGEARARSTFRLQAEQQAALAVAERKHLRDREAAARAPRPPIVPPILTGGRHGGGAGSHPLAGLGEMGHDAERFGRMGVLGAVMYGAYSRAQLIREVNHTLFATRQDVLTSPWRSPIQDMIQQQAGSLALPIPEVGAAVREQMKMLATMPIAERMKLLPSMLQWARVETLINPEVSLSGAIGATAGLMHQWSAYSPEQITKLQPVIAALSTLGGGITIPGIENAASYTAGTAQTAGIGMDTILAMVAAGKVAGVRSTKAGTWVEGLIKAMAPKGGFAALVSSRAGRLRLEALQRLGLVGPSGEMTGMEMLQRGDVLGLQQLMAAHLQGIPPGAARVGLLSQAAGSAQAGRELEQLTLPGFAKAIALVESLVHKFGAESPDALIKKYGAADPFFQFNRALADARNALIDLDRALPLLTAAINGLDQTIKAILPPSHGGTTGRIATPTTTIGAAAIGGWLGTMGGPFAPLTIPLGALFGASLPGMAQVSRDLAGAGYAIDPTGTVGAVPLNSPKTAAPAKKPQGWGDWLWSFIFPSAHAAEMPGGVATNAGHAIAKATGASMPEVDFGPGGLGLAKSFALALPMVDFGPAGLAIAAAVAQAMGGTAGGGMTALIPLGRIGRSPIGHGFGGPPLRVTGSGSPEADALLSAIASGEARSYNALYGGGNFGSDFSHFPNWSGRMGPAGISHAAGLFEFEPDTWRTLKAALHLPDFGPDSQRKAALALAEQVYGGSAHRDLLADVRSGHLSPEGIAGLHRVWPSIGGDFAGKVAALGRDLPGAPPATVHRHGGGSVQSADAQAIGGAVAAAFREHLQKTGAATGDTPIHVELTVDGHKIAHVVAHHLGRSIARDSKGVARSGARPDFTGFVLPPPM